MSLKLYFHPLSSFCQKALIAFYENGTPFEPALVDLGEETSRNAFLKVWPIGKFPVLADTERGMLVPESSIIIEYLAQHYPGKVTLVPAGADLAWQMRLEDRFYDLYVNVPVQKIVTNKFRPPGQGDAFGVEHAKGVLQTSYGMIEQKMATRTWPPVRPSAWPIAPPRLRCFMPTWFCPWVIRIPTRWPIWTG